jgi:hypothetical protein
MFPENRPAEQLALVTAQVALLPIGPQGIDGGFARHWRSTPDAIRQRCNPWPDRRYAAGP